MQPPCKATKADWPPNYVDVWAWRQQQLLKLRSNPVLVKGAKAYYRSQCPSVFIMHWLDTYDPRNAGGDRPARMPFIFFERQVELVQFIMACLNAQEDGLMEKARDMGATWVCCGVSVWLWLYQPGASIGWGSRKEQLVDKLGDPDSIFEKMRMLIRAIPKEFLPKGFNEKEHMTYMRIVNPETGATITGEAGDNIGRGGRKLMYFKDESAHYERPEKVEAALSENTRVQMDISSVNGVGNVFHRRREAGVEWYGGEAVKGKTNVFVMDWSDHPDKDQDWYEQRRRKFLDSGLGHVFAQEVDRNYAAALEGVIIPYEWVNAAVDSHLKLDLPAPTGKRVAGLDVADEGMDRHAVAARTGYLLEIIHDWGQGDQGETARRAIQLLEGLPVEIQYDSVGVGAGVKSEANRLRNENLLPQYMTFVNWSAGAGVQNPDEHLIPGDKQTPTNKDYFDNLKAQAWWQLRLRFERTFEAVTKGVHHDPQDLISLPSEHPRLPQLKKELSQATISKTSKSLKLVVDKSPPGTKSPNLADAAVMAYWPVVPQDVVPALLLSTSVKTGTRR